MARLPDRVFIVLREDVYETIFGDGYFAHLVAAFRSTADAEAYAKSRPDIHDPAATTTGYRYHVKELEIAFEDGRPSISSKPKFDDGTITVAALRELLR